MVLDNHGYQVWQLQNADPERPYVLPILPAEAVNSPPTVHANESSIVVDEGQTAMTGGTVTDTDGDSLTISASAGTATKNNDSPPAPGRTKPII